MPVGAPTSDPVLFYKPSFVAVNTSALINKESLYMKVDCNVTYARRSCSSLL